MTSTMQTMFSLLMNKEENSVVSIAYGYNILGACFDGRMDLDEARHILRDPVYYGVLQRHSFDWCCPSMSPHMWTAESEGYKFVSCFETGYLKMYHHTENGWEETWKAPVSFQLMILDALLVMRVIDHKLEPDYQAPTLKGFLFFK